MQPLKTIFSRDLLERYKAGERIFEGINLQYADISGAVLKDIVIKDSRFFIVALYNCNLKNAKFINCEINWGSFYGGNLENAVFEKCTIDLTLFENVIFKNTKILKSAITWSAFFGTAVGELDTYTSTLLKVLTDISQLNQEYIDGAMRRIGPVINSMDISIRAKIKQEMERDSAKYGVQMSASSDVKTVYGTGHGAYSKSNQGYGASMLSTIQSIIHAYNTANPYHTKKDKNAESYKG